MQSRGFSRATSSSEVCADAYAVTRALLTDRGTDDCSVASEATEQALLQCRDINGAQLWSALADEAEYHGVAPLIEPMITALSRKRAGAVPDDVRRAFVALASRHRRAAVAREKCIDQLLAAFAIVGIPIILLKGAALAHRIYPGPELRPMVDIDVLIDPADMERAVAITRGLGYSFALRHELRFAGRLHHLPAATTYQSGFRMTLEIHVDAIPPDLRDSLTLATLTAKPAPFQRGGGPPGLALGHTDMLRHLARHAFGAGAAHPFDPPLRSLALPGDLSRRDRLAGAGASLSRRDRCSAVGVLCFREPDARRPFLSVPRQRRFLPEWGLECCRCRRLPASDLELSLPPCSIPRRGGCMDFMGSHRRSRC